ncbi:hypothetical protein CW736_09200 [Nonlabens sp. MB-3u-79]|uniref:hypothetical protein n=1 Tax=Nonlabens sp. MB-3u-79 TaxID=2058134 RepID=UPI000C319CFC|nr:hypothetical protein [Nonlabens sp. MB-3u-79]AUC79534.1 hypothetical protein CW736_09200 [Nonlabens sp. MB-3u-79]
MKISVIATAGFLSFNLVDLFLHKEYKVVGLDNFSTIHLHNTAPLEKLEFFTFIKADMKAQSKL